MRHTVLAALRERTGLIKYAATSVLVYVYVFAALYGLVDLAGTPEVLAYVLVYAGAYLMEYTATMRLVFGVEHRWRMVVKYALYVGGFFGVNTLLYTALLGWGVHYLLAALLVALALMPLRYLVNKLWVYR